MKRQNSPQFASLIKGRFTMAGIITSIVGVGLVCPNIARLTAQQAPSAAAFEVASVRRNMNCASYAEPVTRDTVPYVNFNWSDSNTSAPAGGLFSAKRMPLNDYIAFAYKITMQPMQNPVPSAPKWVATECFDIDARGEANATKDQMRLMLRSLLADRFKLAAHWEVRKVPTLVLALEKPGKLGPELHLDTDSTPCGERPKATGPPMATIAGGYPAFCGDFIGSTGPGGFNLAARKMTMESLAHYISSSITLHFFRPVADRTGLTGSFDMKVSYTVEPLGTTPQVGDFQVAFTQALKNDLGLKLESSSGPVNDLVIDHIEEPTPN